MAFEFRYQRILDVREREEEQEQAALAEVQNRLREERAVLDELEAKLDGLFDEARESRKHNPRAHQFRRQLQQAQSLRQRIARQREVVETWEKKLDRQRQRLIEASQQKRVMETLRENQLEAYRKKRRREEQRRSNEIATRQYYRENRDNA